MEERTVGPVPIFSVGRRAALAGPFREVQGQYGGVINIPVATHGGLE